ncbi:mechanosensitive ion channel domain-containing protein [Cardiobacterium hominis]|uniref:mechanosensitive ion channel domain-containing protein n=1 Tax=Cardiobacterium hominis TaxID=2718 RepID=UPI0028E9D668|nr:mechanosensitive ion channel domain-containing protein [Cardiobacterium hominis]
MWRFCLFFFLFFGVATFAAERDAGKADDKAAWAALADVLENPAQRKVLIAQLRQLDATEKADKAKSEATTAEAAPDAAAAGNDAPQGDAATGEAAKDEAAAEAEALKSVAENAHAAVVSAAAWPKKVAGAAVQVLREVGTRISDSWDALVGVFSGRDLMLRSVNFETFWQATLNLALIIGATLLFLRGLQLASRPLKRRLQERVLREGRFTPLVRRLLGVVGVSLLDVLVLALSLLFCSLMAVLLVGETETMTTQAEFFMRAFVAIELLKIGIRTVFYPRYPGLRLLPCTDAAAIYWNRWFATLLHLLGYGYLVAFPLIKINLSPSLGMVFSALLALSAFIYGMVVVIRQRSAVRLALRHYAEETNSVIFAGALRVFSSIWHLLAIAYFLMLFVLNLLSGEKELPYVLRATSYTILWVCGGLLLSALMTQYIHREIRFKPETARRLPGLAKRLNFYVPLGLRFLRFGMIWLVCFSLLDAWSVIDLNAWAASPRGLLLVSKFWNIFIILAVALITWLISVVFIERYLSAEISVRTQTLLSLFRSAWAVIIFVSTAIMILIEIGINIGPLIAGAGVFGLAVGFGAQTLVKDVITGIFFQIENAINTGDIVTVDGITGRAEQVGIRSVGIRDSSGTYHLIPFSNVTRVSNYMRGHANHIAEYGIAYRENIDEAMEQLRAAFNELVKGEMKRYILEPINIQGVSQLADSAVMLRVSIKTTPGDQWVVGRAYNRLVKMYFDAAGIEMPFPTMEIYFGQDKDGSAPPLHVRYRAEGKTHPAPAAAEKPAEAFHVENKDDIANLPDSGAN